MSWQNDSVHDSIIFVYCVHDSMIVVYCVYDSIIVVHCVHDNLIVVYCVHDSMTIVYCVHGSIIVVGTNKISKALEILKDVSLPIFTIKSLESALNN